MIIKWISRLLRPNEDQEAIAGAAAPSRRNGRIEGDTSLASVVDPPHMLHAELERARRYEHDLSIVALSTTLLVVPDEGSDADAVHGAPHIVGGTPPQVVSLVAAAALREVLRESDVLCFQPMENRFILALTESDGEEAVRALARIRKLLRDRLRLGIEAGIARFPEDALTLEDLIEDAAARARGPVAMVDTTEDHHPASYGFGRPHGPGRAVRTVPNLRLVKSNTEGPSDA